MPAKTVADTTPRKKINRFHRPRVISSGCSPYSPPKAIATTSSASQAVRGGREPRRSRPVRIIRAIPTGIAAARQAIEMPRDMIETMVSFRT
jgi:hypothetical protein